MRKSLLLLACLAAAGLLRAAEARKGAEVVLDHPRVRVLRASDATAVTGPGFVVVPLRDGPRHKAGEAYWSSDPGAQAGNAGPDTGPVVLVEPRDLSVAPSAPPPTPAASKPGESPFVGISFEPLFENDKVTVMRGRMEADAREAFHTHASDIVLVHLSGGAIEDTANGVTKVNRWKPGDVELETRGSSHSARNVGGPLEAVLVVLKP
jgi:quercetin dioxygenase-like cupin family protein